MRYKEIIRNMLEILDADLTDGLTRDDYDLDKTAIGGAFSEIAEVESALERFSKPHKFEKYLEIKELQLKGRLAIMGKIRAKAGDIRRELAKEEKPIK